MYACKVHPIVHKYTDNKAPAIASSWLWECIGRHFLIYIWEAKHN